jgi:thiosulfate/3-mercaptopyruvate sulfurtransferase
MTCHKHLNQNKPVFPLSIFLYLMVIMMLITTPALAFDLKRTDAARISGKLGSLAILDARPLKQWEKGHLPGALPFSWETYTQTDKDGIKYRILPPAQLAASLGDLGIKNTDAVLVYGDADSSWGGEGWLVWMLAWLGHKGTVYFLDGGIQSWRNRGEALTTGPGSKRKPSVYGVDMNPGVNTSHTRIKADRNRITLIDTRSYLTEWLPGHLPDAVHIPWEKFYQGPERRIIGREALKDLLKKQGVDMKKPLVFYCTGGIRSGFAWLAATLAGLSSPVNFEGGTEEWNHYNP